MSDPSAMETRARIEAAFWSERGSSGSTAIDRVLQCAAVVLEVGVRLRNRAFEHGLLGVVSVGCPVVCVGNLTVGGSGKTPVVAALAESLANRGERVGILSRGYGGTGGKASRIVVEPDPAIDGDEAAMLAARLPSCLVVVGPDRVRSARLAIERGATVLVLDDGFQHRRLARDLDIVVVDGARGLGNGFLLPRGPLREPPSGLRRAQLVLVKRSSGEWEEPILHGIRDLAEGIPVRTFELVPTRLRNADGREESVSRIRELRVAAVCGIGNPAGFIATLERGGAQVVTSVVFRDHHRFSPEDVERIADAARAARAERVITTAKDLGKLACVGADSRWQALEVGSRFDDGFDLPVWVTTMLAARRQ